MDQLCGGGKRCVIGVVRRGRRVAVLDPSNPSASIDVGDSGDCSDDVAALAQAGQRLSAVMPIAHVGRCQQQGVLGGPDEPLVGGDRGRLGRRLGQGVRGDGPVPVAAGVVGLGGLHGQGVIGEHLAQDQPLDLLSANRLSGLGLDDEDISALVCDGEVPPLLPCLVGISHVCGS